MKSRREGVKQLFALAAGTVFGAALHEQASATLAGPAVLSVHSANGRLQPAPAVHFDMTMLASLAQVSYSATTPWYGAPRTFSGPLLRDVLAAAGAQEGLLRASALNDYRVDIPWSDSQRYELIVARLRDGLPLAVRDKGPLFLMYPFNQHPELRTAVHYSRAAWQLRSIEVL